MNAYVENLLAFFLLSFIYVIWGLVDLQIQLSKFDNFIRSFLFAYLLVYSSLIHRSHLSHIINCSHFPYKSTHRYYRPDYEYYRLGLDHLYVVEQKIDSVPIYNEFKSASTIASLAMIITNLF